MSRQATSMNDVEAHAFLALVQTAILCTIDGCGLPHAAPMWYVVTDTDLRMVSYLKSQKSVNLTRNSNCAFVVEDGSTHESLRGVMVRGEAVLTHDFEEVSAIMRQIHQRYSPPPVTDVIDHEVAERLARQAQKRMGVILPLDALLTWDHRKMTGTD